MQHAESEEPPDGCIICLDPRQYVGWDGQRWTTLDELTAEGHRTVVREEEPGLIGIGVEPAVAIGQRSLLVTSPDGNLLWDVPGFVDDAAMEYVAGQGGLLAVSASHPHFYGVMTEWADAFEVPLVLPEADLRWITRAPRALEPYADRVEITPEIAIVRCGGHFPGSAVAHWTGSQDGHGVLLSGDSVAVAQDRDWVSFMWSYPNLIPVDAAALGRIEAALGALSYDRIYGGWWRRAVASDAQAAVRRSIERYLLAISDLGSLEV